MSSPGFTTATVVLPLASGTSSCTVPTRMSAGNTSPRPVVMISSPTVASVSRGRPVKVVSPSPLYALSPVRMPLSRVRLTTPAAFRLGLRMVSTLEEVSPGSSTMPTR